MERQRDDRSRLYILGALFNSPAVDADVAAFDDSLRLGAAFDEPDAMEKAIDPHGFLSLASSAKA